MGNGPRRPSSSLSQESIDPPIFIQSVECAPAKIARSLHLYIGRVEDLQERWLGPNDHGMTAIVAAAIG
jgi:hypothetical protein